MPASFAPVLRGNYIVPGRWQAWNNRHQRVSLEANHRIEEWHRPEWWA